MKIVFGIGPLELSGQHTYMPLFHMPIFHIQSGSGRALGKGLRQMARQALAYTIEWLTRLSRRITGVMEADDLQQEISFRLTARNASLEGARPSAYLAATARNLQIDEARKLRVRGGPAIALDDLDEAHAPWVGADQESALLLKQVILALPPLYRDVFIMSRFVGLTYAEIGQKLGVSVKTIEYRMSRALALCEEALRD